LYLPANFSLKRPASAIEPYQATKTKIKTTPIQIYPKGPKKHTKKQRKLLIVTEVNVRESQGSDNIPSSVA
jgi:hypothetical protein